MTTNTHKTRRRRLAIRISALALATIAFVPFNMGGCASDSGGGLNLATIGNVVGGAVGGKEGNLISAGGKAASAATINPEQVNALGQSVAVAVAGKYGVDENDTLTRYVTLVGLTVASATPSPDANFVFGVLDTDQVNAFAAPNGYILITRGALMQMEDESELAGVLAHEIAHVVREHGLDAVRAGTLADAGKQASRSIDGVDAGFFSAADGLVDMLINKGWSVDKEYDADQAAVEYLVAAGYDPHGYERFLRRMQAANHSAGGATLMSTHPGLDERVGRVSNKIQGSGATGGATLADRFRTFVPRPVG